MTREEAIEILKRVDICANAAETARDMAIAALKEQKNQSSSNKVSDEWISVKERLPSGYWMDPETGYREPEEYIVFVKGAGIPTFAGFIEGKFIRPEAIYREDLSGFADEITHWMPLPEPPKEVAE